MKDWVDFVLSNILCKSVQWIVFQSKPQPQFQFKFLWWAFLASGLQPPMAETAPGLEFVVKCIKFKRSLRAGVAKALFTEAQNGKVLVVEGPNTKLLCLKKDQMQTDVLNRVCATSCCLCNFACMNVYVIVVVQCFTLGDAENMLWEVLMFATIFYEIIMK